MRVALVLHVTVEPVAALNPVDGDQLYVPAPVALMLVALPMQIFGDTGVMVSTGTALTVMVSVVVATHPAALVPVIV